MTTEPTMLQCPACEGTDSIEQTDGRLCLSCLYEGPFVTRSDDTLSATHEGPAEAKADAPTAAFQPPLVPDTDDPDDDDDERATALLAAIRDDDDAAALEVAFPSLAVAQDTPTNGDSAPNLAGSWVHVASELKDALVVEDDGSDFVAVMFHADARALWRRDDLRVIGAETAQTDMHDASVHDAAETVLPEVMFAIAAAILTAAADSIADDEERTFTPPLYGWAPPPADQIPEMELAAAYAVAILIRHYDLSTTDVRTMAANLINLASAVNNQEGNNSDNN